MSGETGGRKPEVAHPLHSMVYEVTRSVFACSFLNRELVEVDEGVVPRRR